MTSFFHALFFVLLSVKCFAHGETIGARSLALGKTRLTKADVFATNNNQAMLAYLPQFSIGSYYENRFFVKELNVKGLCMAIPLWKGSSAGATFSSFGNSSYSEQKLGIGIGKLITEKLALGIQVNYVRIIQAIEYGARKTITAEGGLFSKLLPTLCLGFHIYNPTRTKLAEYNDERIPMIIALGLKYEPSEKLCSTLELNKDSQMGVQSRIGIEYFPVSKIVLRLGCRTQPLQQSFGIGYRSSTLQIDIASDYHTVLGFSSAISLSFSL